MTEMTIKIDKTAVQILLEELSAIAIEIMGKDASVSGMERLNSPLEFYIIHPHYRDIYGSWDECLEQLGKRKTYLEASGGLGSRKSEA